MIALNTVSLPAMGEALILEGVDWAFYQALGEELYRQGRRLRLAFDRGRLEIMSTSPIHEAYKKAIDELLIAMLRELRIPKKSFGSMQIASEELQRGLQPDECYYIRNEPAVRGRYAIAIPPDPPPSLALEVLVSAKLDKLPIYAALGVPEVWRYDGATLRSLHLQEHGTYAEASQSLNLPFVPLNEFATFIRSVLSKVDLESIDEFLAWVRATVRPAMGSGEPNTL